MIRFSVFGIPVTVQPFFWITLALIGGALRADSALAILFVCLFLMAGFLSILIHELGHALTARKFGAYSEITLQAFGGYAAYHGVRLTRPQSFAVTAAGPLLQIVAGLAVYLSFPLLPPVSREIAYLLQTFVWISIFWAVLNMLPILPLDGGQLLNAVLGPQRIRVTLWVTIICACVVGILMYQRTGSIIFPIFLAMFAWQAWQALRENQWR